MHLPRPLSDGYMMKPLEALQAKKDLYRPPLPSMPRIADGARVFFARKERFWSRLVGSALCKHMSVPSFM